MSFRFVGALLWAGLLSAAAMSQTMTAAMAATCAPTNMRVKVTTGTFASSSTTFVSIPGSSLTFVQGGTRPSCVVIRFSGASSVVGNNVSHIQAVLNDVTAADPGQVQFSGENIGSVSHAFDFFLPNVAPGSHTVRMMIRVDSPTDNVFIDERTLIVQHAP